ncbi:MAG: hypothetical protein ACYCV8_03575 [bacterium]
MNFLISNIQLIMTNIINFLKTELVPLAPIGTFIGTVTLALVTFFISKSDRFNNAFSVHKIALDKTAEELIEKCDFTNIDLFSEFLKKYFEKKFENKINILKNSELRILIPALLSIIFQLTTENKDILKDIFTYHLKSKEIKKLSKNNSFMENCKNIIYSYEYINKIKENLNFKLKEIGLTVSQPNLISPPLAIFSDESIDLLEYYNIMLYTYDINVNYEIRKGIGTDEETYFLSRKTGGNIIAKSKSIEKLEKFKEISLLEKEKINEFNEKNERFKEYCESFCRQAESILTNIKLGRDLKRKCPYTKGYLLKQWLNVFNIRFKIW